MSESRSVSFIEEDDKIELKDLGKIGAALRAHLQKYSDVLIPLRSAEDKKIPRVEDL